MVGQYNLFYMYTQKQEQKIKTIDLNQFLDGFHNYRTLANDRQTINSHPFTVKLRNHIKERAQTCFSIQTFHPQTRSTNRTNMQNRYSKVPLKEQDQNDLDNINIDQFMHAICTKDNPVKENQHAHQFIRSLNGTWFQGTNQQFKCAKIFNTLGIKKSRSLIRPRTERYNHQYQQRDRIDFTKQCRPNGLFPSRKTNIPIRMKIVKSPSANHHPMSPSKINEGSFKYQIVNSIKNQLNSKPNSRLSSKGSKNNTGIIAIAGNFNNQKIVNKMNKEGVVKGKKMVIYD